MNVPKFVADENPATANKIEEQTLQVFSSDDVQIGIKTERWVDVSADWRVRLVRTDMNKPRVQLILSGDDEPTLDVTALEFIAMSAAVEKMVNMGPMNA